MQKIILTLDVNGNEVTREFSVDEVSLKNWNEVIEDMNETLEASKEEKF